MDMSDFLKTNSPYISAADVGNEIIPVTIKGVTQEQMRDGETKAVVWFQNKSKGLVLNKTNGRNLVNAFGKDSDSWPGNDCELYTEDAGGTFGRGTRIRPDHRRAMEQERQNADVPFDDKIPF